MFLTDLPVIDVLRHKMKWHLARQAVLAENVANSDTPDYKARDLVAPSFARVLQQQKLQPVRTALTNVKHIPGPDITEGHGEYEDDETGAWETTPSGNAVNLEEEMMKVTANHMDYQTAATLYRKSIGLLRIAVGQGR